MQVKAQGLLNAAKHIEENYGQSTLAAILRSCSPAVRETYVSSIAINWHPVDELCEFVDVAQKVIPGRPRLAAEIGAAGARANMKGMLLRIAFYIGRPEMMMRRAAGLWRQFNDEGTMELLSWGERVVQLEVRGVNPPRATFCGIITGWCSETTLALGVKHATAHHAECRAKGDRRCLFEVRGDFRGVKGAAGDLGPDDG